MRAHGVNSNLSFPGSTVLIILPQFDSTLFFSWDSTLSDTLGGNDSVTTTDYVEMAQGGLTWTAGNKLEKLIWILDAAAEELVFDWKTQVDERERT